MFLVKLTSSCKDHYACFIRAVSDMMSFNSKKPREDPEKTMTLWLQDEMSTDIPDQVTIPAAKLNC